MEPLVSIPVALAKIATEIWKQNKETNREVLKYRNLIKSALSVQNLEERQQQVRPLISPIITLLHSLNPKKYEQKKLLHIDLSMTYELLGEEQLKDEQLNNACDCVVRQIEKCKNISEKNKLRKERDALLTVIKNRKPLIS